LSAPEAAFHVLEECEERCFNSIEHSDAARVPLPRILNMYQFILRATIAAALFGIATAGMAGSPINTGLFGSTAIKGYDPVAYQSESKAVKGSGDYVYDWNGAKWQFASQSDLDKFKSGPDKYAPQYGGYCAYAVGAKGEKVGIDPEAFTVLDGKLYLNYSKDIQKKWEADRDGYIKKGDVIWPSIKDK